MTCPGARRDRRLTRSVAVALALALASGCSSPGEDPEAPATPRPSAATSAPTAPRTLADLPRSTSRQPPYALGRTLVLGDRQVDLPRRPMRILDSPHAVIVSDARFSVLRVDKQSLAVDTITDEAAGPPVLDPSGRLLAWQQPGRGSTQVAVVVLDRSRARPLARHSFPAAPTCCDSPFQVVGITGSGDLFAALPGKRQAWVWNVHHDRGEREIRGLRGGYLMDTTASEVVVLRGVSLSVGDVKGDRYRENVRIDATGAVSDSWVLSWLDGGKAQVAARTPGDRGAPQGRVQAIGLPPMKEELPRLRWLDADAFLLDATDSSGVRALVRCEAPSGRCEVVVELDRRALVAE